LLKGYINIYLLSKLLRGSKGGVKMIKYEKDGQIYTADVEEWYKLANKGEIAIILDEEPNLEEIMVLLLNMSGQSPDQAGQ